jgi:hypothetical protein
MLGYSTDLLITKEHRKADMRRFDSYGDMSLALHFRQVEGLGMESDDAGVFCRISPRFAVLGVLTERNAYAYVMNPVNTEFNRDFDEFVTEFRKTDAYRDMLDRVQACTTAPFVPKPVENPGASGEVMGVLVYDGWEPVSYRNTSTNQWEGVDIELVTRFANTRGAKIEFIPVGSYTQAVIDLGRGKARILICPDSLGFKKDLERARHVTMSACVWEKDIVVVVNTIDYPELGHQVP